MFKKALVASVIAAAFLMSNVSSHAASADLGDWKVTFEDAHCVADGQAMDIQNGDIFTVRIAHPSQRQERLIFGLYTKDMAQQFAGKVYDKSKVRFYLAINDEEFKDAQYMFDPNGTLVIGMDNTLGLQVVLTENSSLRIVLFVEGKKPYSLALLQMKQVRTVFNWLNRCARTGLNSIRSLPQ